MLATLVDAPFHRPGWVYEEKYDGYRILAYKEVAKGEVAKGEVAKGEAAGGQAAGGEGGEVTLLSRNAKDRTATFPEVARAVGGLGSRTLLLDGEVVGFDPGLVSRFQLLQQGEVPHVYMVFDCLYVDGRDLRAEPLRVRRAALEAAIGDTAHLFPSRRLGRNGLAAYALAEKKGFEGIVAKDESAPYVEGRSTCWLKVKAKKEDEFVIGGYTPPGGTRPRFGALLLGAYTGSALHYVGKVGTGFTLRTLAELHRTFQPFRRPTSPFVVPPREKGATWIEPRLVAQVAYQEWTADRKLRQPVFLGLRDDKRPEECVLP